MKERDIFLKKLKIIKILQPRYCPFSLGRRGWGWGFI